MLLKSVLKKLVVVAIGRSIFHHKVSNYLPLKIFDTLQFSRKYTVYFLLLTLKPKSSLQML